MTNGDFIRFTPPSFQRPGLDHIVYAQTRRSGMDPLAGNVGETAVLFSEANHKATQTTLSRDEWEVNEKVAVTERIRHMESAMGLSRLAMLRVVHGVGIVDATEQMEEVHYSVNYSDRPPADIAFVTQEGDGEGVATGDCPAIVIAQPGEKFAGIVHAGFRGILGGALPTAIDTFEAMGLERSKMVAYVGPHAHIFQLDQKESEEARAMVARADDDIRREFTAFTRPGINWRQPAMNMTRLAFSQLNRAGIRGDRVSVSTINTVANGAAFSHYNAVNYGAVNGRTGVAIGIELPN